ncbi:hypothetical protein TeGR_g2310, partial [Tetraparma gracilis]
PPARIADISKNPRAGLNFPQFVDCICRLGLVGYASGTWADMFPSSLEKVHAVFLTHLGLLDSSLLQANIHGHQKSQGVSKAKFEGMSKLTKSSTVKDLKGGERSRRRSQSVQATLLRTRSSSMIVGGTNS